MSKIDFKKELKEFYVPSSKKASIVQVPKMTFIMIDGAGDPNTSEAFQQSVEALYALSYGIKMFPKKNIVPEGYFDYVVPPLEGRWDTVDGEEFDFTRKDKLKWTVMIMQPEFVTHELFDQVRELVKQKKDNPFLDKARLEDFEEGVCAQILHLGSYDDEPHTLELLEKFIEEKGYRTVKSGHHEIYLSDPRRTKPEKLRTTLRYPIVAI